MTISDGAMVRGILDGPPEITEDGQNAAHGKLLRTALYERDPLKRGAARRALMLLFDMADGQYDDA